MARMGVPNTVDEVGMGGDMHAPNHLYASPDMPGRHSSGTANVMHTSPHLNDGDKYFLAAKVNSIYGTLKREMVTSLATWLVLQLTDVLHS